MGGSGFKTAGQEHATRGGVEQFIATCMGCTAGCHSTNRIRSVFV